MSPHVAVVVLLGLAPGAFARSLCNIPLPRDLVGGAQTVMRVHAVSESELEIVGGVYGHDRRGFLRLADHQLRNTCVAPEEGVDDLACETCGQSWAEECTLSLRRLDHAADDEGSEQRWPSWLELDDSLNEALTTMYASGECVRAAEILFHAREASQSSSLIP